jgi:hypothetical protein
MWIALTASDFWNFCKEQKIYLKKPIEFSKYPNRVNIGIWIELDERYSNLPMKFSGPIFLSHVEKIIPFTQDAEDSIKQLIATFPNLTNYVRM